MLRPTTLRRAFVASPRLALPKATPQSTTLAARNYSTPTEPASPAATPTSTSTPAPPAPPASTPSTTPTTTSHPYTVHRTPSNQLAVYHLSKRGGNMKLTAIKKVEGDRARFRAALAQELGVEEKTVVVNNLTGHVIVKGHQKNAVTGWLEKQGF
ncbi:mitochondrial large subunit ribosomal protein-domain-containing protein [Chaetomium tenue]|uniref:Mitochondrial large subunit ribosomal protein-domain-containing protein n=1 Tax=Chaetomium tenue TaxID=1854479 RepID=A0ACB7PDI5_9PEZI|nr:mitochondrial large subunit ribosomal protein-domain-containing protein [Chaetomium globosum]